jgi:hypothetical protein
MQPPAGASESRLFKFKIRNSEFITRESQVIPCSRDDHGDCYSSGHRESPGHSSTDNSGYRDTDSDNSGYGDNEMGRQEERKTGRQKEVNTEEQQKKVGQIRFHSQSEEADQTPKNLLLGLPSCARAIATVRATSTATSNSTATAIRSRQKTLKLSPQACFKTM